MHDNRPSFLSPDKGSSSISPFIIFLNYGRWKLRENKGIVKMM
jgi:hypothetical protein